ncbi:unnamed protein product [Rangifer tarandus platyrhynchus]|uniref:Uncharacterized protein n=1 Tax=Rangifer tarandus platyrhynchus TaxID=3082113 RepID=A0ABN8ZIV6_RANTA|nr:unnamed protein product [Rangifer tarandus platyrhynchus]
MSLCIYTILSRRSWFTTKELGVDAEAQRHVELSSAGSVFVLEEKHGWTKAADSSVRCRRGAHCWLSQPEPRGCLERRVSPPEPRPARGSKARTHTGAGPAAPPLQAPGRGPGGPCVLLDKAKAYFTQAQGPADIPPEHILSQHVTRVSSWLNLGPGTLLLGGTSSLTLGSACPCPAPPGLWASSTPLRSGSCTRLRLCPCLVNPALPLANSQKPRRQDVTSCLRRVLMGPRRGAEMKLGSSPLALEEAFPVGVMLWPVWGLHTALCASAVAPRVRRAAPSVHSSVIPGRVVPSSSLAGCSQGVGGSCGPACWDWRPVLHRHVLEMRQEPLGRDVNREVCALTFPVNLLWRQKTERRWWVVPGSRGEKRLLSCTMCCLDAPPGAQTLLQPRGPTVVKAGNEGSQAAPATVNSLVMASHVFCFNSLRTLPVAPVLSALQVPHTQRLQVLRGDDCLRESRWSTAGIATFLGHSSLTSCYCSVKPRERQSPSAEKAEPTADQKQDVLFFS